MFACRDVFQLIHVLQVVVSLCVTSDAYYDWLVQLAIIKLKITSGPISTAHPSLSSEWENSRRAMLWLLWITIKPSPRKALCRHSVAQSCSSLWPHCSTPGFPVLHHLPELAQIYIHWVSDARERFLKDTNCMKWQPLPNIQVEPLCKPTQNCELLGVPQSIIFQGFVAKDSEVSQSERRVNNSD